MKKDTRKALEWVAFFTSAKDDIIAATPEQAKIFAILLANLGLRPHLCERGCIPLDVIQAETFSLQWGISEESRIKLFESSPLWAVTNSGIQLPAYAYEETSRVIRVREGGRKGGKKKAQNAKKNGITKGSIDGNSNKEAEPQFHTPGYLATYINQEDNTGS